MRHSKKKKILLVILIVPVAIALFGYIVMSLWNWLVPTLFEGPTITFWQGLGLLILSKILFGGFGKGHNSKHSGGQWKRKFKEMSPEERENFKSKWASMWCPQSKIDKPDQSDQK